MCETVLKKRCRELGLPRWPYRELARLRKKITTARQRLREPLSEKERNELLVDLERHKVLLEDLRLPPPTPRPDVFLLRETPRSSLDNFAAAVPEYSAAEGLLLLQIRDVSLTESSIESVNEVSPAKRHRSSVPETEEAAFAENSEAGKKGRSFRRRRKTTLRSESYQKESRRLSTASGCTEDEIHDFAK